MDEDENEALEDFQRRFYWTLPLTRVVFVLAMLGHRLTLFDRGTQDWIELAVTLPVVLWAGWPFFARGAKSVVERSPNMWTLIGLGTGSGFVYSVVATVAPQVFPASFVSMGHVAVYFEAAAVIKLTGATLNTGGALVMRADKVGAQTVLANALRLRHSGKADVRA